MSIVCPLQVRRFDQKSTFLFKHNSVLFSSFRHQRAEMYDFFTFHKHTGLILYKFRYFMTFLKKIVRSKIGIQDGGSNEILWRQMTSQPTKMTSFCKASSGPSSETQGQLVGARGNKSGKKKKMKRPRFTNRAGKAPGNRLLPHHFQAALPMLPPDWTEKSFVLFCPIGEQQLLGYFAVFLHEHCYIGHTSLDHIYEGNFHSNLLNRAIEIREIISDVIKKETLRFAGKIFASTDQGYRKIVACLLASRFQLSFIS